MKRWSAFVGKRWVLGLVALALVLSTAMAVYAYTQSEADAMKADMEAHKGCADSYCAEQEYCCAQAISVRNDAYYVALTVPEYRYSDPNWTLGNETYNAAAAEYNAGGVHSGIGTANFNAALISESDGNGWYSYPPPQSFTEAYECYWSARDSWDVSQDEYLDCITHFEEAERLWGIALGLFQSLVP